MTRKFSYVSKWGSESFGRKLRRIAERNPSRARWLLSDRERKHGRSLWNPAYGILECGGARCAYTDEPVAARAR